MHWGAIIVCVLVCAILITASIIAGRKAIEAKKQEEALRLLAEKWQQKQEEAQKQCELANQERDAAARDVNLLQDTARRLRDLADESAQSYYNEKMRATQLELEQELSKEQKKFQDAIEEYQQEYTETMSDMSGQVKEYSENARQLLAAMDDLKAKQRAAIEAAKRKMKEHDSIEFHRIQIPESDLLEIERLREVIPYLRDKETLNKVIYKIYYENPTNDLIGRVVGKAQGGIYKITNIENGMCYVGQAVNFANRWKQHIKRGVGAEPITHNKLYPAMQKEGVENFTFEVIEECPASKLNEREQYWQDYFGAKEFGYSIK